MSSIYRKGRDGYFYYQTYVLNPDSGKKDKKVFHSLGTKDEDVARKLKLDLDKKYLMRSSSNQSLAKKSFLVISFLLCFIILIFHFFSKTESLIEAGVIQVDDLNNKAGTESTLINQKILSEAKIEEDTIINPIYTTVQNNISDIDIVEIPKYTIEVVENISGPFNQGKISVTIPENINTESQYMLCKKLKENHQKFSSIIICIYSDTPEGKDMANGRKFTLSENDQRDSWLSMYSYNSVEGEYFDSNPSEYLENN